MAKRTGGFIGQDGLNAPDPATGVTGAAGDGQVTVSWTNPTDVGGAAITGYNVQAADGSGTIFPSYDVESASYDTKSFSVSSQDTFPTDIVFNPSGTKMYVVGNGTDKIYEYDLSTANDVSTAVYNSVSFDNSSQATDATGVVFNNDGTKMYIVSGGLSRFVYQYSLSTAYNVSSASYDSVSLNVGNESTDPTDLRFNNDGSKLFVLQAASADSVFQYSLTSNFDLSTASYDSVSFSVSGQETTPTSLAFNSDGTKMFILGIAADAVFQYSLSSAFNLSNVSYDNVSFDVSSQENQPRGLAFNNYGDKLYVVGYAQDTVYQFSTGAAAGDYPTASPVTVTGLTNGTSYTFNVWAINPFGWSSPSDASGSVSPAAPRALFAGGNTSSDTIDYVEIGTTGNATDFGNLLNGQQAGAAFGSSTRSIFYTGTSGTFEFVNPFSAGNATDFGDPTVVRGAAGGASNSTRGLLCCGESGGTYTNIIDYVTISTAGNATDFGDMQFGAQAVCATSSPTRMVAGGGFYYSGGFNYINYAGFVTIASTGNSSTFGNLTASSRIFIASASSNTRGLFAGGGDVYNNTVNTIEYITTASTGDFTDFGDMSFSGSSRAGTSNNIRAVFGGGRLAGGATPTNIIDYVSIATTGNATDFGDLTAARYEPYATSSAHGGLS